MKCGNFLGLALAGMAISANLAAAHGENKPGPHGGHMRMPGAFHTELVSSGDNSFTIYLVDVKFENADAKKSSLTAIAKSGAAQIDLNCETLSDRFLCKLPDANNKPVKPDQLVVKAKYLNFPAGSSIYDLPLTFEKPVH